MFHDPAAMHDVHAIAELCRHRQVVGHHQQRVTPGTALQKVQDARLHGGVQGGGGFVRYEQGRAVDQRQGDHDALPLSSGELVGVGAHRRFRVRYLDRSQCLDSSSQCLFARQPRMAHGALGQRGADAPYGVERSQRILKDEPCKPASQGPQFFFVQ